MSWIAVLGLTMWFAGAAFAQGTPAASDPDAATPTKSAIRTLLEAPETVVVARIRRLDPVPLPGGSVTISAIGAFEPGAEQQRVLGIRIELAAPGLPDESGHHYLDVHQIEGLLKGLFLLEQVASDPRDGFESEADYETIEGFRVGITAKGTSVRFWVEGGPRTARVRVSIPRERVGTLRQRLELARTRLFME